MIFTNLRINERQKRFFESELQGEEIVYGHIDDRDGNGRTAFRKAEIAFGAIPEAWLEESKAKWIQHIGTGVDGYTHLDWKTLGRRLTFTKLPGFYADPVAQTGFAGILALLRGLHHLVQRRPQRHWETVPLRFELDLLTGKSVLLAGYGAINRRLEELLRPFQCRITRFARTNPDADIHTVEELDAALPTQDIVVLCLPGSPATENLFHSRRITLLQHHAILVNLGRGNVVDETALVERLQSGTLGGAVLDVVRTEPLPPGHPLWSCPNTILTQHTGGGSRDEIEQRIRFFHDNYHRFRNGGSLVGTVDWNKGY